MRWTGGRLRGIAFGRQLVRNAHGKPLPCVWDDCWEHGDNRHRVEVDHDAPKFKGEKLVYIFCSERHRDYWRHSTKDRGNLPTGSRGGLVGPLGLPL